MFLTYNSDETESACLDLLDLTGQRAVLISMVSSQVALAQTPGLNLNWPTKTLTLASLKPD